MGNTPYEVCPVCGGPWADLGPPEPPDGRQTLTIEVPGWARGHFFEEPPPGHAEFWAFRSRPNCRVGDRIRFTMDRRPVAEATVWRVEEPGKTKCQGTGRFGDRFKVYWRAESFRDLRPAGVVS